MAALLDIVSQPSSWSTYQLQSAGVTIQVFAPTQAVMPWMAEDRIF
jgi:hypothetical protein